jgi:hypothetical protein
LYLLLNSQQFCNDVTYNQCYISVSESIKRNRQRHSQQQHDFTNDYNNAIMPPHDFAKKNELLNVYKHAKGPVDNNKMMNHRHDNNNINERRFNKEQDLEEGEYDDFDK